MIVVKELISEIKKKKKKIKPLEKEYQVLKIENSER